MVILGILAIGCEEEVPKLTDADYTDCEQLADPCVGEYTRCCAPKAGAGQCKYNSYSSFAELEKSKGCE